MMIYLTTLTQKLPTAQFIVCSKYFYDTNFVTNVINSIYACIRLT